MGSLNPFSATTQLKTIAMKNTDPSDNSRKLETEHFIQLIRIAFSNSVISRTERELLYRTGGKLGFSLAEVEALIEKTVISDYAPPHELPVRFEHAYDLIRMTLADGRIDKSEMKLVTGYIEKTGFMESEIPRLILLLLKGIKDNRSVEELFALYMKDR
jgi:hypothetical protein